MAVYRQLIWQTRLQQQTPQQVLLPVVVLWLLLLPVKHTLHPPPSLLHNLQSCPPPAVPALLLLKHLSGTHLEKLLGTSQTGLGNSATAFPVRKLLVMQTKPGPCHCNEGNEQQLGY